MSLSPISSPTLHASMCSRRSLAWVASLVLVVALPALLPGSARAEDEPTTERSLRDLDRAIGQQEDVQGKIQQLEANMGALAQELRRTGFDYEAQLVEHAIEHVSVSGLRGVMCTVLDRMRKDLEAAQARAREAAAAGGSDTPRPLVSHEAIAGARGP